MWFIKNCCESYKFTFEYGSELQSVILKCYYNVVSLVLCFRLIIVYDAFFIYGII